MKKVDYYECLGITKTATHDEVKQAYRKLALVLYASYRNIIQIKMKIRKKPKSYSRKSLKHIQVT